MYKRGTLAYNEEREALAYYIMARLREDPVHVFEILSPLGDLLARQDGQLWSIQYDAEGRRGLMWAYTCFQLAGLEHFIPETDAPLCSDLLAMLHLVERGYEVDDPTCLDAAE